MRYSVILSLLAFSVLIGLLPPCESSNILFFFGVSTYSHRITAWNFAVALAERGHNVTFFHPYHAKKTHPKVKEFFPKEIEEAISGSQNFATESLLNIRLREGRLGNIKTAGILPVEGENICRKLLAQQVTLDWVATSQFDLLVIDGLFNDCGLGFAYKWNKAKVILFGTSTLFSWLNEPFGIVAENSWIPEVHVSFQYPMNFGQRIISTMMPLFLTWYKEWVYYPKLEAVLREGLSAPDMPPIAELERNVSLILLNTHFSEEFARSFPPLVVPVAGVHLDKPEVHKKKPIPEDMVKFIEESGDDGFILVSFGSAAQISEAPKVLRNIFFTSFKNSKTRFVWKWEGKRPAEMPANVFTAEWLPQSEVLGHPKIKAFISHGGLMSVQESITHAVPMITFPIFAEQDYNSFRIERTGRGIRLEISELTLGQLQTAISEILKNPKYKQKMVETRKVFEDRPMSPVDTAIWWTEYVLRHEDTAHLKPLSMHQTWYERRLLDVWGFIGGMLLFFTFSIIFITKKLVSCILCRNSRTKPKLKTN